MTTLVCVQTFRTRAEAELAQAALEAAGIPASVRADDAGGTEPALVLTTGGAKVLVGTTSVDEVVRLTQKEA